VAKARNNASSAVAAMDKVANLLALILTKDMKVGDQIVTISRAGFQNQEIADLLGSTTGHVAQALYEQRKGLRKKKKKGAA
jgi:hypothetical protein